MDEKNCDGMELSLSLSLGPKKPMQLSHHIQKKTPKWNHHLYLSSDISSKICKEEAALCHDGLNINQAPSLMPECRGGDNDAGVSSPNSTLSSVNGKRSERDEERPAGSSSQETGDDDDVARADGGAIEEVAAKKKLRLTKEQAALLEETFKEHSTLNPKQKVYLAKQLNLRPRQVEVWFQNRRARTKLKQTEVDCEDLRRCCENLTEENRRLQKDVQELRAVKLSHQLYMHVPPSATFTLCPTCERVAFTTSSSCNSSVSIAGAAVSDTHLHQATPSHPPRTTISIIPSWTTPMHLLDRNFSIEARAEWSFYN